MVILRLGTLLFKLIHDLVIHSLSFIYHANKCPAWSCRLVVHLPIALRVRIFPFMRPYKADAIRRRPWFDSRRGMTLSDLELCKDTQKVVRKTSGTGERVMQATGAEDLLLTWTAKGRITLVKIRTRCPRGRVGLTWLR